MQSKLPSTIQELADAYGFSTKYMSKQFKELAYEKKEPKPKRLRILTPKRVVVFIDKFGTPDTDLPN